MNAKIFHKSAQVRGGTPVSPFRSLALLHLDRCIHQKMNRDEDKADHISEYQQTTTRFLVEQAEWFAEKEPDLDTALDRKFQRTLLEGTH